MVVKELIAKLGFQVDAGTIAASDAAIGSARKSLMETSVAADTAGTGMKKFGADAVTAGTEARAAGAEASTAFGARLKASIASSAASMQAFGREVQNIKNQLMGLGMMAVGGFGLFELADGAIETGHQVSQLSQRLRINQDDALQLSRIEPQYGRGGSQCQDRRGQESEQRKAGQKRLHHRVASHCRGMTTRPPSIWGLPICLLAGRRRSTSLSIL